MSMYLHYRLIVLQLNRVLIAIRINFIFIVRRGFGPSHSPFPIFFYSLNVALIQFSQNSFPLNVNKCGTKKCWSFIENYANGL